MLTGKGKSRWKSKLSFHHRSSSTTSSSISSATKIVEPPPAEFLCPISSSLMADPVILPTGHSLDRPSLEACRELSFSPPSLDLSFDDFFFIPNVALKSAIVGWCDRSGLPRPVPLSSASARDIVRTLMAAESSSSAEDSSKSKPSSTSSSSSITSDETLTPKSPKFKTIAPDVVVDAADPLEEEMLERLKDPQISVRESALAELRQLARESSEKRSSLCTQRLLSALIPFLLSRTPELQINAAASLVNLSIDPHNKVGIVRSGAVPTLVEALKSGHPEARDHAAGAVFSLAIEEDNRLAIGVLGAIPPLVHLFYQDSAAYRARKEAGMALYHLTLAANNTAKLAKTSGAARAIVRVASERGGEEAAGLRRIAMMVMGNMAGRAEGRVGLMDAGAVGAVVGLVREGAGREEEQCIGVLYGLSRGSLRFRALARAAGAEEVLDAVLKAAAAATAAPGKGEIAKEMVRKILRVVRGEEDGGAAAAAAVLGDEDEDDGGSVVSDGLVSFRRRYHDFGSGKGYSTGF
ncbi:putative U-box domain-containing protein 39 [Iris pallida]|uniref:RING-type E3 ubiquitin transferase n=1 Tax=Iris pallida TaxID=29817 RepID=A0AAX6DT38_IRIPA|nr:putative U-box domain-containing protein 39 [Iris pallida]